MGVHTIPVAFDINAETEQRAAEILCAILEDRKLVGGRLESWWMPNHPDIDHHDADDPRLQWIDGLRSYLVTFKDGTQMRFHAEDGEHAKWQARDADGMMPIVSIEREGPA